MKWLFGCPAAGSGNRGRGRVLGARRGMHEQLLPVVQGRQVRQRRELAEIPRLEINRCGPPKIERVEVE